MDRIGEYKVDKKLGAGGTGEVFLCRHPRLPRKVVVKLLNEQAGVRTLEKFDREADALAGLQHPNILQLHDKGIHRGRPYFVMDHVDGEDLSNLLKTGSLVTPDQALFLARSILLGLAYAHSRGVIHRDIKPSNLRLTSEGVLKILDFGVAHLQSPSDSEQEPGADDYKSPEQITGMLVDERTDLFSTGIVLYELLTGKHPFPRRRRGSSRGRMTLVDPAPPRLLRPELPLYICWTVLNALERRPENRPDSAELFAEQCRINGQRFQSGPGEPDPAYGQADSRIIDAQSLFVLGREAEYEGRLQAAAALYAKAVFKDPDLEPAHIRMTHIADAQVKARDIQVLAKEVGSALAEGRLDGAEEAMHRIRLLEPDWEANEHLSQLERDIRTLSESGAIRAYSEPGIRSTDYDTLDGTGESPRARGRSGKTRKMPGPEDMPDQWPAAESEDDTGQVSWYGQKPTPFVSSAGKKPPARRPGSSKLPGLAGRADFSVSDHEQRDPAKESTTQPMAAKSSGKVSRGVEDTQPAPAMHPVTGPFPRHAPVAPPRPADGSTPHGQMEHMFLDRVRSKQFDAARTLLQELVDNHANAEGVRTFVHFFKPKIDAERMHQLALGAYKSNEIWQALEMCEETLRLNPRHGRAQALKNRILIGEDAENKKDRVRRIRERVRIQLSDLPTERSLGIPEGRLLLRSERDLDQALSVMPGDQGAESLLRMVRSQLATLPSEVLREAAQAEGLKPAVSESAEISWEKLGASAALVQDEALRETLEKLLRRMRSEQPEEGEDSQADLQSINDCMNSLLQASEEPFTVAPEKWRLLADRSLSLRRPGDPLAPAFLELSLKAARVALGAASERLRELAQKNPSALKAEIESVGAHAAFYTLRAEAERSCEEARKLVKAGAMTGSHARLKATSTAAKKLLDSMPPGPGDAIGVLAEALLEQVPEALGSGYTEGMDTLSERLETWIDSAAPHIEKRISVLRLKEKGRSKEGKGDLRGALEAFKKVAALDPDEDEAGEAVQLLEQRLERESKVDSSFEEARKLRDGGKLRDAVGELQRLLTLDPDHDDARTMLEECQNLLAKTEKIRALKANISDLAQKSRWQEAREQGEELLKVSPEDDEALEVIARADHLEEEERQAREAERDLLKRAERQLGSVRSLAKDLEPIMDEAQRSDLDQIELMMVDARESPNSEKSKSVAKALETLTRALLETRWRVAEETYAEIASFVDTLRDIEEADRPYLGDELASETRNAVDRALKARQQQDFRLLQKESNSIEGLVNRLEARRDEVRAKWLPGIEERLERIDPLLEHIEPSAETESISTRALEEKRRTTELISGRLIHPLPHQIVRLDEIISELRRNQAKAIAAGKEEVRSLCQELREKAAKSRKSVARSAGLEMTLSEIYREVDRVDEIADPAELARLKSRIRSTRIPAGGAPRMRWIAVSISAAAIIAAGAWGGWIWWNRPSVVVIQLVPWGEISSIVNSETHEVIGQSTDGAAFHRVQLPRGSYQIKAKNRQTQSEGSFVVNVPEDRQVKYDLTAEQGQPYDFLQPLADALEADPYFSDSSDSGSSP